jgi:carbamoylphosphate synthase large subunit
MAKKLKVLLSEGASTSAREAITVLGLAGHDIEVIDSSPYCLGRFSRFVRRFHRCPPMGVYPEGYLDFVLRLLANRRFDVLVPIHEQGYLFAKVRERIESHVAVALPSFDSYQRVVTKVQFSQLLRELDLPQPRTKIAAELDELRRVNGLPLVIKTDIGTASRGVWMVKDRRELLSACDDIERADAFGSGVLAQELINGPVEHAQAVFSRGRLLAMQASGSSCRAPAAAMRSKRASAVRGCARTWP